MLEPTTDIGQLYHNTSVKISQCGLEFLFARFAWSIFPLLSGFISAEVKNRLVVKVNSNGDRTIDDAMDPIKLQKRITASRTNSPTKRSRIASELDEAEDEEVNGEGEDGELRKPKRKRISADHINIYDSSPLSYIHSHSTIQDDSDSELDIPLDFPLREPITVNSSPIGSTTLAPKDEEFNNEEEKSIRRLREEALARQRPLGWPGTPKYWRHRPAREELERMGVEILGDDDLEEAEGQGEGEGEGEGEGVYLDDLNNLDNGEVDVV